jgi:hypothetical protein
MNISLRVPSLLVFCFGMLLPLSGIARSEMIVADKRRNSDIEDLSRIIRFEDAELRAKIPYLISPFFFKQPILLELRRPGGMTDTTILAKIGIMVGRDVSGAFVRGNTSYLIMKNGELLKEGDSITRSIPEFGNMQAQLIVGRIGHDSFILKLNRTEISVELAKSE